MEKQNKTTMNTNLIGISGKIGSGKDLIANIIQYLICIDKNILKDHHKKFENFKICPVSNELQSGWKIKKFADAPKEILCILLGCTRSQLESQEFKNSDLPEYLCRYDVYRTPKSKIPFRANISYDELQWLHNINKWEVKKTIKTVRDLLIYMANDVFRDTIGQDIWVNTLFNQYKGVPATTIDQNLPIVLSRGSFCGVAEDTEVVHGRIGLLYPNWIITDVRYQNEADYIKNKGGILIRTNRWVDELIPIEKVAEMSQKVGVYGIYIDGSETLIKEGDNLSCFTYFVTEKIHRDNISETHLDNYDKFDFVVDNNGFNINYLIEEIANILQEVGLL